MKQDEQVKDNKRSQFSGGDAKNQKVYRQIRVVGLAMFLPLVMVTGPVVGYLGGDWVGRNWLGGVDWIRFLGLGLGTIAAIQQTVLIVRRLLRELK